ncbi:MAG: PIG-L family deacetylase [Tissierellia bacterium]|nr:PIG-L family deacetylase [Tissierellia bacterium]
MFKKLTKIMLKYPIRFINHIYTYFYYKNNNVREGYKIDDMIGEGERVLVFSPHVDDETIGLGATLLKHKEADNQRVLVYLTDGGGSTSNLSREDVIKERKEEGGKVKDIYGFREVYFLDEADGALDSEKQELITKIVNILDKEQPTIIYTPFLLDGHRDHIETTRSVIKALEIWGKDFDIIYMYEVNCPITPILVNSLSIMDESLYNKKGEVYHIFDSQWAMDFSVFRLLDRRKRFIAKSGYGAEVFVKTDLNTLIEIERELKVEGFRPEQFRQLSSHYNLLFSFKTNKDLKKRYSDKIDRVLTKGFAKQ